jgi:hypothetical protein
MPDPSTSCARATPETAQRGGRIAAVFYPFGHPTPYAHERQKLEPRDEGKSKEDSMAQIWRIGNGVVEGKTRGRRGKGGRKRYWRRRRGVGVMGGPEKVRVK